MRNFKILKFLEYKHDMKLYNGFERLFYFNTHDCYVCIITPFYKNIFGQNRNRICNICKGIRIRLYPILNTEIRYLITLEMLVVRNTTT